jgi:hypothetical protein
MIKINKQNDQLKTTNFYSHMFLVLILSGLSSDDQPILKLF